MIPEYLNELKRDVACCISKSFGMIKYLFFVFLLLASFSAKSQESQLAQQYFKDGEYEKSAELYKKLYEKNYRNDYYFRFYFNSLLKMGDYEEGEKAIKEAIKKRPEDIYLLVRQGGLLENQGETEKALKLFEKAIEKLNNNQTQIIQTASAFMELSKFDYALKVYEKGVLLTGDESLFAANLADLYRRNGNLEKMIRYYLVYSKRNVNTVKYVKQLFQRQMSDSLSFLIQEQLYTKIQEEPEESIYVDMLAWLFVQNKAYDKALRQLIALDKRLNEDGNRVFELAATAEKDKDLQTAIKAYRYIIDNKKVTSPYYLESKRLLLNTMRQKLDASGSLPEEELLYIREGYLKTLDELGKNNLTASLSIEYAEFEAYFMDRLDIAIETLQEIVGRIDLNDRLQARAKLDLGDYYLMSGEIWESSLLYSQVDKSFQEGFLGEVARYKNARLSYFNGDFEWSKIQLDVLKSSTSKLISNDAIDLSVFISENIGLDSTTVPLKMYANAELKALQHKQVEAFETLDSIYLLFPDHELEDDIWYLKANIYSDLKDYDNAVLYYQKVIEKHSDDIRGDNAMFELAELYENILGEPQKAAEIYEKIFIDYSSSTFAIEARKKYRSIADKAGEAGEELQDLTPEELFMQGKK